MPKYVLIIDDDEDDRDLFSVALQAVDPSSVCVQSTNGQEALKFLRKNLKNLPDFIFLDLNMPRVNGKQCVSELKRDDQLKHIPVVIYTTSKLVEDKDEMARLGAIDFITKPSRLVDLCDALTRVFKKGALATN
jgi:CheY-like chemotaxis protein